jgi:hypothetical protein
MPLEIKENSDLQRSFELYDRQVTIGNIQLGCLLGMVLMPAGLILDYFVYPNFIPLFYNLRILCSVLIGVFWLFVRSPIGRRHHRVLGVLLAMFPAFFISLMIGKTTGATAGAASPYYAGLNLVLLVVGFILHWTLRESIIATTAVVGILHAGFFF